MHVKFPFDTSKPVVGEASIDINKSIHDVFAYIGEHFFDNYPKWALEVVEFEPLDGKAVVVGAKAKQVREDNGAKNESIFEIIDYQPSTKLIFKGLTAPYQHSYLLDSNEQQQPTHLTFRFELLELEVFMRPFQKLIRSAIEEGAENTVENIKKLIALESNE
ncbi:MAG: SRPBCC family protein [Methylobacter sp.]|nr:SRPBCC family protein [Methylobacter sp.]MDP2099312.1 SRPBCC family protein [Methylobacter sp.]MDP2428482.1 SRPBCC family protein [Methylobacter sp.]MDP3055173.1 SRPBCC family protein [Methylobacter sp.]MDP3363673.1 SRPBCC family protein [Methylobacter sp.]